MADACFSRLIYAFLSQYLRYQAGRWARNGLAKEGSEPNFGLAPMVHSSADLSCLKLRRVSGSSGDLCD